MKKLSATEAMRIMLDGGKVKGWLEGSPSPRSDGLLEWHEWHVIDAAEDAVNLNYYDYFTEVKEPHKYTVDVWLREAPNNDDASHHFTEYLFEVGKKYRYRNHPGWAKFLAYSEDAMPSRQAVFVTQTGWIIARYLEGNVSSSDTPSDYDILPGKYVEPFKPRLGTWKMRDGSLAYVVARDPENEFCIDGYSDQNNRICWNKDGCLFTSCKDDGDLVEFISSDIPERFTTWPEED